MSARGVVCGSPPAKGMMRGFGVCGGLGLDPRSIRFSRCAPRRVGYARGPQGANEAGFKVPTSLTS